ncbi:hypothetical protein F2P81_012234 [Scophthalmus maximus]|uniref:Uncharacterized protein n=1 Tax=Scophthalmus maximus TaxID=52904 RepID=A0A6A4SH43_SCOMX|nr:hypothetical protein F2P81_012234 [Scophthalmus maximus]
MKVEQDGSSSLWVVLYVAALAACDAIVLSRSYAQVLVHCSPEFSQTCCIDIQGLFRIPITAPPHTSLSLLQKTKLIYRKFA